MLNFSFNNLLDMFLFSLGLNIFNDVENIIVWGFVFLEESWGIFGELWVV